MGRVILQQVRISASIPQIVDRHNIELVLLTGLEHRPENVTANATESIDCYFDRHWLISLKLGCEPLARYYCQHCPIVPGSELVDPINPGASQEPARRWQPRCRQ